MFFWKKNYCAGKLANLTFIYIEHYKWINVLFLFIYFNFFFIIGIIFLCFVKCNFIMNLAWFLMFSILFFLIYVMTNDSWTLECQHCWIICIKHKLEEFPKVWKITLPLRIYMHKSLEYNKNISDILKISESSKISSIPRTKYQ